MAVDGRSGIKIVNDTQPKTYPTVEAAIADGVPPAEAESRVRVKLIVTCTWDDVPHLDAKAKARLLESYPSYQKEARSKGVPSLGSGSIYQVPESLIRIAPFEIPRHFKRGYGLDVGWNRTAGVFGAWDQDTQTMFIYDIHYLGQSEPTTHAEAIKARGKWLPGKIDPAARGRSQEDGDKLIDTYREKGLNLTEADHAVEAGLTLVNDLLVSGRLKVFATCGYWFEEYRLYRRDEKGQIVKQFDHLMDATRYLILSGVSWLETPPGEGGYSLGPTAGGGGSWLNA